MIYALLLAASIVLGTCKSMVYNRYAKNVKPDIGGIFSFNMLTYGVAAIIALICGTGHSLSAFTLLTALCYAVFVFSLQALSVAAMITGPMSLTSLMVLYGMVIPALAGPVFWKEPFGAGQVAGVILMLLSIGLLCLKGSRNTGVSMRWGIMAAICFLLSGSCGVAEKVHQSSSVKDERLMFLFIACVIMFFLSLSGLIFCQLFTKKYVAGGISTCFRRKVLLLGALSGVIVGFYTQTNLTLSGKLDSLIYYPIANGGALMLTVAASVVICREKLSKYQFCGLLVGLPAIILLGIT